MTQIPIGFCVPVFGLGLWQCEWTIKACFKDPFPSFWLGWVGPSDLAFVTKPEGFLAQEKSSIQKTH